MFTDVSDSSMSCGVGGHCWCSLVAMMDMCIICAVFFRDKDLDIPPPNIEALTQSAVKSLLEGKTNSDLWMPSCARWKLN